MSERRFHLVDTFGNPLDERYEGAANEVGKAFRRFPHIDPADLDNVLSQATQQTAALEAKQGRLGNLKSYLWRAFLNGISDLCRTNRYRVKLREVDLTAAERRRVFEGRSLGDALSRAERHMIIGNVLATLDDSTKAIVRASIDGYSSKELAVMFNKTEGHINVIFCRVRKKITEALNLPSKNVPRRSQA